MRTRRKTVGRSNEERERTEIKWGKTASENDKRGGRTTAGVRFQAPFQALMGFGEKEEEGKKKD